MNGELLSIVERALAWLLALATLPGSLELLFVTMGGVLTARKRLELSGRHNVRRLAIVVPSHNEESHIGACVSSLLKCYAGGGGFTVVVVADNCDDGTAHEARQAGATVLVRDNLTQRGKGYALHYAFTHLDAEGYELFVVVDADSSVTPNLVREFHAAFAAGSESLQCRYKVRNAADSMRTRLMNCALMGFNILRPRGRDRFGLSAGILGNGFGVTRETLQRVPYTANSLVEDLEYHLRLVRAGLKVRFVDAVTVFGEIPSTGPGVSTQRRRWEGGRFRMVCISVPDLLREVARGRYRQIEPTLELLLLPLGFHVGVLLLLLATHLIAIRVYAAGALVTVALHVLAAVIVGGGCWADIFALLTVPLYVIWKIRMLPEILRNAKRGAEWVRTEREMKGPQL
jgi:cellulose synthase/poly-beta-1,6-N-acetylglucosamine synthase-like glycosyltransferase